MHALRGVDLDLFKNDLVVLLGASGSGYGGNKMDNEVGCVGRRIGSDRN